MTMNEYQNKAKLTAIYPKESGIVYTALGLNGEAGEVAEKVKKMLRDNNGELTDEIKNSIVNELGDVLWYLANLSNELGVTLQSVGEINIKKLQSRMDRDQIKGSGDER